LIGHTFIICLHLSIAHCRLGQVQMIGFREAAVSFLVLGIIREFHLKSQILTFSVSDEN